MRRWMRCGNAIWIRGAAAKIDTPPETSVVIAILVEEHVPSLALLTDAGDYAWEQAGV